MAEIGEQILKYTSKTTGEIEATGCLTSQPGNPHCAHRHLRGQTHRNVGAADIDVDK
jgi:hypothetical protein